MDPSGIVERIAQHAPGAVVESDLEAIDPWVRIVPERLPEVCRLLRDDAEMRMNMLNCISGVDYLETDPKKAAKAAWEPHLEVLYHLSSLVHGHRIVLKVVLPRWKDDVAGRLPEVPSVSGIWSTANWHEREVYDLVGVRFVGHPDLRRILCPEDWQGHPLRKDYQMPEEYHGIPAR